MTEKPTAYLLCDEWTAQIVGVYLERDAALERLDEDESEWLYIEAVTILD